MPILGFGELLWDLFPNGARIPGGAPFNFAFHCQQLGHEAIIVSRVGDDELGHQLLRFIRAAGMSTDYIQLDPTHQTGRVEVTLDQHGVPTYRFAEQAAWEFLHWNEALRELSRRAVACCHGTLALTGHGRDIIRHFEQSSPETLGRIYDVNLRRGLPGDLPMARTSTWVKVNAQECDDLLGQLGRTSDNDPASTLFQALRPGLQALICTAGEAGITVITPEGCFQAATPKVQVVDTVGAGDATTAALLCYRLEGRSWTDSIRFAMGYASKVCEQRGATPFIDRAEVERLVFS